MSINNKIIVPSHRTGYTMSSGIPDNWGLEYTGFGNMVRSYHRDLSFSDFYEVSCAGRCWDRGSEYTYLIEDRPEKAEQFWDAIDCIFLHHGLPEKPPSISPRTKQFALPEVDGYWQRDFKAFAMGLGGRFPL